MKSLVLSLFIGLSSVNVVLAQPPQSQIAPAASDPWASLRYDPVERGPLLVVRAFLKKPPASASLIGYTEAFEGRVFTAGNLSILAPRERTVLNPKPGKPNLFANMPAPERLKLFLGTCSEAQWKALGSTGLGIRDIPEEQKALFQSLLPVEASILEAELVAGDTPNSFTYKDQKYTPVASESFKLHIGVRNQYFFFEQGKRDTTVSSGNTAVLKAGKKIRELQSRFESRQEGGAFGQEIFVRQPNALKPSALNYEALRQPVLLEGCATVADALARVSQATRLELHADKRVSLLPLYLRVAPGQTTTAGNLLQGLALGVTGTFRALAPGVFLLTDDLEGIGSRWNKLAQWGADADTARRELLEKAANQKRSYDPTALVGYRPDDPAALPTELYKQLKETWKKGGYALSLSIPALPNSIQQDIQERMQYWKDDGRAMDEARVEIRGAPKIGWVLPSGEYIAESLGLTNGLGDELIHDFAPKPSKPDATPSKAEAPSGLPESLKRRLLALRPITPAEAQQAVREAKRLHITDLWVQVMPSTTDLEPLKAAIAQGKATGIAVGVLVPLLRDSRMGQPERVLSLKTGEEFAEESLQLGYVQAHPEFRSFYELNADHYRRWRVLAPPDEARLDTLFKTLATLPGLAGIALKHTGGPGFAGEKQGGDGIDSGGDMGYTPERRLAFVRKDGYDPIDFGEYSYALSKTPELPFFSTNNTSTKAGEKRWLAARQDEAKARLKRLYTLVQRAKPGMPLFISDRVSDYTSPNTLWYGSWDAAEKLPENPVYAVRSEAQTAARRASASSFLLYRRRAKGDPGNFVGSLEREGKATLVEKWSGLWMDLSELSLPDALSLLTLLPK
jgi:hypothetical protein